MENHFNKDIIPLNDSERLRAVHRYLDAIPQDYFVNLATIMARTFDTPIALISFVDKEQVKFMGNFGMEGTSEVSRGLSLCSLAVLDDSPTVFDDATKEPCLLANPLVTGAFGLRFYAGAPIITPDGYAIGTACIVDKEPRTLNDKEIELLKYFSQIAMKEVETRYSNLEMEIHNKK
jgi:GAF domain-containing protein